MRKGAFVSAGLLHTDPDRRFIQPITHLPMKIPHLCLVSLCLALCAAAPAAEALRLTLPPAVYGVPGVPLSIYFDNIVLTPTPENYRFEVKCPLAPTKRSAGR